MNKKTGTERISRVRTFGEHSQSLGHSSTSWPSLQPVTDDNVTINRSSQRTQRSFVKLKPVQWAAGRRVKGTAVVLSLQRETLLMTALAANAILL